MTAFPVPRHRPGRLLASVGVAAATALLLALAGCGSSSGPGISAGVTTPPTYSATENLSNRGAQLYVSDGCSACHSSDGSRSVGPTFRSLAYAKVTLATGQTVTATPAFLRRELLDPAAAPVKGYPAALMERGVAPARLAGRPRDVTALVTFIEDLGP
jgi:mono/diheme cytochrome c family protein